VSSQGTVEFPGRWAILGAWLLSPLSMIPLVATLALVSLIRGSGDTRFFVLALLFGAAPIIWLATLIIGVPVVFLFHHLGWRLSVPRLAIIGAFAGGFVHALSPRQTLSPVLSVLAGASAAGFFWWFSSRASERRAT
jgi:hypothetical protein